MDALENLVIWDTTVISPAREAIMSLGGKALGLHELKNLGINVPHWLTITAAMFKQICVGDKRLNQLLIQENSAPLEKARQLRDYLKEIQLESRFRDILTEVWDKISEQGRKPLAVRSSASDEDSQDLSFAGQMDSFLNIRSLDRFLDAIRGCWLSVFGERAVLYRIENGIDPWSAQIAIVVQQMVESEISGVIFTVNPLTGNTREMLISSTWGLGEGLVSGALDSDTFILDANGQAIKSEIAEKKERIVYNQDGGTRTVEVEPARQSIASLDKHQLKQLHCLAFKLQDFKARPMDIEFGIADNEIYLLQCRPITKLKKYSGRIWDNSNIVESYSGVTTPLTFSFIQKAYFAVYCQFCETIGIGRNTIFKNRYVFANMLGLIEGRVYYNLLNWYRLVSLMPGFKYNRRFMEQMMGLQVIKEVDLEQGALCRFEKYFIQLPRLIGVGCKMILAHLQLEKKIAQFQADFKRLYSYYSCLDYANLTSEEMLEVYRKLEDEILWKWKAPITNDFEAMIFYGLLKSLTLKWGVDTQGVLQNDLLCGGGGIRSTEVTTRLFYIAQAIGNDSKLKTAFLEVSPEEALDKLRNDQSFTVINEKFENYLKEYGVRCINEMKLESIPLRDNPVFCICVLQNYLRNQVPQPALQEEHERSVRKKAEAVAQEKLKNQRIFLVIPKLNIYRWVLENARRAIKNRENQRFCRTEAYSLIRTIVRAIGKLWEDKGIIEKRDDIFYLEIEEVWSFIEGTSTCVDLKGLIALRKKEFAGYLKTNPDDHIETHGEVYSANPFKKESAEVGLDNMIKGLGCCAGIVEKEVLVVLKPDTNLKLNGEIMVAKQTDPGWVVLFPSISGLIVEKGSMLSHSAIVAREMGIPAVVGVKNATRILNSGDKVLLNGAEGTIRILEKAKK